MSGNFSVTAKVKAFVKLKYLPIYTLPIGRLTQPLQNAAYVKKISFGVKSKPPLIVVSNLSLSHSVSRVIYIFFFFFFHPEILLILLAPWHFFTLYSMINRGSFFFFSLYQIYRRLLTSLFFFFFFFFLF